MQCYQYSNSALDDRAALAVLERHEQRHHLGEVAIHVREVPARENKECARAQPEWQHAAHCSATQRAGRHSMYATEVAGWWQVPRILVLGAICSLGMAYAGSEDRMVRFLSARNQG